jgi:hypothetical protein
MQYQKIYDQIIQRAKTRNLMEYGEKHHILPRCLGGNNLPDNIVKLTFREHFICHWILCKLNPGNLKLHHAFSCMTMVSRTNKNRFDVLTSRHFQIVKTYFAPFVGKWNKGKTAWNKGLTGHEHSKHYKNGKIKIPNMTGYKWINNGLKQTKIPPGTEIPDGWKRGRMDINGENNPMRKKNEN